MLLPRPPLNTAITPSTQTAVTIVMGVFAGATLLYSIVHLVRTRKPTFLLLFLAGGSMMAMEPAVDTVGGCWFPKIHAWVVFTAYGRPIPLWLCLAYFFYFGIGAGVYWLIIRRGVTSAQLWGLFLLGMFGDFVLETVLMHFNTYYYYGGQPLRVLKFPLWWAPVNSVIVVVVATVAARFERHLAGRRQPLIIPLAVSLSAALNCAAGWPSWLAINSTMPSVLRQVCGLVTFALAGWFVSLAATIAPAPEGATEARSRRARVWPRAQRAVRA